MPFLWHGLLHRGAGKLESLSVDLAHVPSTCAGCTFLFSILDMSVKISALSAIGLIEDFHLG